MREVKVVIHLRSGKEVVQPPPKLKHGEGSESEKNMGEKKSEEGDHDSSVDEEPRIVIKEDMMKKHMPPPFLKLYMVRRELRIHQKFLKC